MRGRSPVSRLCSPPEASAKRDHLAQGLRQLAAQEVFQPLRRPGSSARPPSDSFQAKCQAPLTGEESQISRLGECLLIW